MEGKLKELTERSQGLEYSVTSKERGINNVNDVHRCT